MSLDKIIVPLDVPSIEDAIALIDQLQGVSFWKGSCHFRHSPSQKKADFPRPEIP
ncbi:MAG: hypothetical protein RLZZ148_1426 [Cyanobacteriota bacterium]